MKTKTKRTTTTTEISIERDEVQVISKVGQRKVMWCAECGREAQVMIPEEAMLYSDIRRGTLSDWLHGDGTHYVETSTALLLIFVDSP